MPRRRLPDNVKAARGTLRPSRVRESPAPTAVTTWPKAPKHFTDGERAAWQRLGRAVLELGSVSKADLLFCERVAQVSSRVDAAMADKDFKPTALNALLRLEADLRRQLGISPQARGAVQPLPQDEPDDADDPLSEFSGQAR